MYHPSSAPPAPHRDLSPERAFVALVLLVTAAVGMVLGVGCAFF